MNALAADGTPVDKTQDMADQGKGAHVSMMEAYRIAEEPYYRDVGHEVELFRAAHDSRTPVMLKGPTGCGKTRFVEHMAWRLGRPLITVSCHEDMTASDMVGRYLLDAEGTVWHDGPLTLAVRHGAICYLDEIVEARQDTTVVIHSLTDDRRILPLEKKNEVMRTEVAVQSIRDIEATKKGLKVGFEGGQMRLLRRIPKVGFKSPSATVFVPVNVGASS